jgi:hypothetical protein
MAAPVHAEVGRIRNVLIETSPRGAMVARASRHTDPQHLYPRCY